MRTARAILLTCALASAAHAQTLDLGSMGGPDLGERSVFVLRAPDLEREANALLERSAGWDAPDAEVTREVDAALAFRAGGSMRLLAARCLRGEGARNSAADHRMLTGLLITRAIPGFDDRVQEFINDAALVHGEEADGAILARYSRVRDALLRFVRAHDHAFGTTARPIPLGFTVRHLDNALRPTIASLSPLLSAEELASIVRSWPLGAPGPPASAPDEHDAFWETIRRASRSPLHAPEARRLEALASRAIDGVTMFSLVNSDVQAEGVRRLNAALSTAIGATEGANAERVLERIAGAGQVLRAIAPLRGNADPGTLDLLDALGEDVARFALGSATDAPASRDGLLDAFEACERALRVLHERRSLNEPTRMTGHMRRAWMLMHTEQGDRELVMLEQLRTIVATPRRLTSPAFASSLSRTKRGYQRLLAIRMSDGWLDELREDGRLTLLLGPTIGQRTRDLLIFTLRDRIRDAADRDVRERALDDLTALRERAERLGRAPIEDALANGTVRWLGEEIGPDLARALADARTAWVQAWVDDDGAARERWAARLGMLVRARDMVVLADRLDDGTLLERTGTLPTVVWPEGAGTPLRDRVRGLARGAVRTALRDDPRRTDDDEEHGARLTVFEDDSAGARALVDFASLIAEDATGIDDPLVRLLGARATLAPADHPARVHAYDIASYVRWVHELQGAERADREAILRHLDEVGADLRARLVARQ